MKESNRNNLIAVYGTLRKGFGNHSLIKNSKYKGSFKTEPIYNLHNLGGFPGLKKNGNTSVLMEVYAVNDEEARWVDSLEGYSEGRTPTFYDKEYIDTPWGKAGVYIYVNDLSNRPIVSSGDYYYERFGKISEEHLLEAN